jgi:Bax inhibitor 1 like
MALIKTANPALNVNSFRIDQAVSGEAMTLNGTVNKTGILLICVVAAAAWSWSRFFSDPVSNTVFPFVAIGGLGGFIFCNGDCLQERMVSHHRADLFLAGRAGAGRYLSNVRAPLSGNRDAGSRTDFWNAIRSSAGVPFGTDSSHRKI